MGQSQRIFNEPVGEPMRDWIDSIPNDGLIRYLTYFNTEMLLVTKPKALNEVLNNQVQNFIKTEHVRTLMSKMMGIGMILAEGDEHKVCMPHFRICKETQFKVNTVFTQDFPANVCVSPD